MASHHWHIERHERFVEKGTCACGAVKFFANDFCPEALKTADDYNKKHGKPGDPNYHNVIKKEEIKTVKQEVKLPPIPPKPETIIPGRASGAAGMQLHKYYMANKDAIIAYFNELGEDETCALWGISPSGWRTLRADLMPERFQKPGWNRFKKEDKPKKKYHKKEKPAEEEFNKEPRPLTEAEELYKQGLLAETKPERKAESVYSGGLPAFPAFNDNWPEKTQCTWLVIWQELMECTKEKATSA